MLLLGLWYSPHEARKNQGRLSKGCPRHCSCLHFMHVSLFHISRTSQAKTCVREDVKTILFSPRGKLCMQACNLHTYMAHVPRLGLKWRTGGEPSFSHLLDLHSSWSLIFYNRYQEGQQDISISLSMPIGSRNWHQRSPWLKSIWRKFKTILLSDWVMPYGILSYVLAENVPKCKSKRCAPLCVFSG